MRYIYFTKLLRELDIPGLISFLRDAHLQGADLAVRPGYPVHPENVLTRLPEVAKAFRDAELAIPLVTAPTSLHQPNDPVARRLFDACAKANVSAIKIGYFSYAGDFTRDLAQAKKALAGFEQLAKATGVKACYHTHSGNYLGSNGSGLRLLLADCDPHHVGAFIDTGHLAIGGEPLRLAVDMVKSWLALVAIKDVAWHKDANGWRHEVVPAGTGAVAWGELRQALRERHYHGVISLHGEYHAKDLTERLEWARREVDFLRQKLAE